MQTPRKQLEFPTSASAFWQVSFEIGNDEMIIDGNGDPVGAQSFPLSATPPNLGDLVLVYNNGNDLIKCGVWVYHPVLTWTRAPGFTTSDVLPSPVTVQSTPTLSPTPRLWHLYEATGAPQINPGASQVNTTLFAAASNVYITNLLVPSYAKHLCVVDLVSLVAVTNIIACGFVPLEDPPEGFDDYEELESMSVSATAMNGFIRFYLYARGTMTGYYRVWYTIN